MYSTEDFQLPEKRLPNPLLGRVLQQVFIVLLILLRGTRNLFFSFSDTAHQAVAADLRRIYDDMVDLRSGRKFPEFEFPGPREEWQRSDLVNWRAFLSDRRFKSPCGAIGDARSPEEIAVEERSIRHISSVFTYPLTIAHAIYWHSVLGDPSKLDRRNSDGNLIPWRITVLGPRAEATLPIRAWLELCAVFPEAAFDLHLVGPEVPEKMHEEVAEVHNNRLTITWTRGLYQVGRSQGEPLA